MSGAVYLLCAATSFGCAVLLWRGARTSNVRMLFWSALCFFGLAIDNLLLYVDVIAIPSIDLSLAPKIAGLISIMLLNFGLIWDSD